jgi:hypothetical protein
MKNCPLYYSTMSMLIVLAACTPNDQESAVSVITTIPFAEAKEFSISDFVDKQSYVLLSTEDAALFKRADKLVAKNNKYYLFDHLSNSGVLVFDQDGNFIQKIGEFGDGPQQLKDISDFQVTDLGDVLLLDKLNKAIIVYSPAGVWKEKKDLPVNVGAFAQAGNKWFLAINYDNQNENLEGNPVFGVFDSKIEMDSLYFQYAEGAVSANVYYHAGLISSSANNLIYHRPPNDTISVFSDMGELKNRIVIDFGANRLPEEVVNDFQGLSAYNDQSNTLNYLHSPAQLVGNLIIGTVASTKNEIWTYVYKLETKELYTHQIDLTQLHLKNLLLASASMDKNVLVSMIDPLTFSQDADQDAYPEDVRAHLENEGTVLLLHRLTP